MKILVLQDQLRSGGTERQSVLLAEAFADAGHAITLATFRPGGALSATVAPAVARHTFQPFNTGLNWFAPGLFAFAARLRPEVILCMGRMANCHAGWLQSRLPGTSVVATMRTGKKLPWLYRLSLRRVRHVVANSHEAARVLTADLALPPHKVTVIHNALVFPPGENVGGVPLPRAGDATPSSRSAAGPESGDAAGLRPAHCSSSRDTLRTKYGVTPATVVLLCVAMFRPEKNQRALIGLAARLPQDLDWQLWFVGEGPTRSDCAALAGEFGVGDRVKFLGFQSDPTPFYGAADLAVLTSRAESLPNFLVEAQAHGLPVVADKVGGVSECFVPGTTGWAVSSGDTDNFLEALAPLLHDPARRAAAGQAARIFAREAFSPAHQSRRYLDVFAQYIPTTYPWMRKN